MHGELETTGTDLEQLRDYLHSRDRDRTHESQGRYSEAAEHVRRTADLRARVHELGQDALATGDEHLARKALRLRDLIEEMDYAAGHHGHPGHRPALY